MSSRAAVRTAVILPQFGYVESPWREIFRKATGCHPTPWSCVIGERSEGNMERDVVCGMQVDPAKAAATSEYNGRTYYFCAKVCKTKFDAEPQKYVKG
jgi:Cu+-exporting ATPase